MPKQIKNKPRKAFSMADTNTLSQRDFQNEIAELAYRFWQQRGSPDGSPDEDWHRAEQEIRTRES